jgi:hypothetical protein
MRVNAVISMNRPHLSLLSASVLLLASCAWADDPKVPSPPSEKITPQTRMLLIRDLTAEHCFARRAFPMGHKGLEIKHGVVNPSDAQVAQLIAENGLVAKPGDKVVISNVVIEEKAIVLEINGGLKKKEKWYQHVQVGMGGVMTTPGPAAKNLDAKGSAVTIYFDKYVPELTGEQVRDMLAPVLDFKALSQAEAYEKTLPPKVQDAIKNHKVLVGMDRDMVIYAKGRPPRKIRDKDEKGQDYEEWIYGAPPEEVDFVRFQGQLVCRLEIMTVDGQKIVRTEREVDLPSAETEVATKKGEEKPANAPTLRRPGEQPENPDPRGSSSGSTYPPSNNPYPTPGGTPSPTSSPDGLPPHSFGAFAAAPLH